MTTGGVTTVCVRVDMCTSLEVTLILILSRHAIYNLGKSLCTDILPARSQTIRRRLGSVTLTGQGLGLGLGTSLFPVGAMEIKDTVR